MIHSLRHGVGPCSSSVSSPHPRRIGMVPVGSNEANTRKVRPTRMSAFGGKADVMRTRDDGSYVARNLGRMATISCARSLPSVSSRARNCAC
jgi:hypothetical protein